MNVLFLGFGRMGSALGLTWLDSGWVSSVHAVDPVAEVSRSGLRIHRDVSAIPDEQFNLIVVAVKPAYAAEVIDSLPSRILREAAVISIAAGVKVKALANSLATPCPVIRAMPNTAMHVGAGFTGLYAGDDVTHDFREQAQSLFTACGDCCWVDSEDYLDIVTAMSGSGPAYFHLFSEALADAGAAMGLDRELARKIAIQTAWGAASLQHEAGADLVALRGAVTSPNGTTAAAIGVFEEDGNLRKLVYKAAAAARARSVELSQS